MCFPVKQRYTAWRKQVTNMYTQMKSYIETREYQISTTAKVHRVHCATPVEASRVSETHSRGRVWPRIRACAHNRTTHRQSRVPGLAMHRHTLVHHSYTWSRADGQLEQASLHTHAHTYTIKETHQEDWGARNSQSVIEATDMQCIHRGYPQ